MTTSESVESISQAMAAAQGEAQNVPKDAQGYGYFYSKLETILEMLRPILQKNGLSIIQSQSIGEQFVIVETMITHTSGEWIKTTAMSHYTQLRGMNDYQSIGSAITYLRRYSIASLFNIASEEDTDGSVSATKQRQSEDKAQPAAVKQETLSDYLKQRGVDAKAFCIAHKITNATQAQALLADKNTLNTMIKQFGGSAT